MHKSLVLSRRNFQDHTANFPKSCRLTASGAITVPGRHRKLKLSHRGQGLFPPYSSPCVYTGKTGIRQILRSDGRGWGGLTLPPTPVFREELGLRKGEDLSFAVTGRAPGTPGPELLPQFTTYPKVTRGHRA